LILFVLVHNQKYFVEKVMIEIRKKSYIGKFGVENQVSWIEKELLSICLINLLTCPINIYLAKLEIDIWGFKPTDLIQTTGLKVNYFTPYLVSVLGSFIPSLFKFIMCKTKPIPINENDQQIDDL